MVSLERKRNRSEVNYVSNDQTIDTFLNPATGRRDYRYNTGGRPVRTTRSPHRSSLDVQLSVDNTMEPRSPTSKNVPRHQSCRSRKFKESDSRFRSSYSTGQSRVSRVFLASYSLRAPSCTHPTPTPWHFSFLSSIVLLPLSLPFSPPPFEDRPTAVLLETIYFSFHSSRRRWMPCLHSDEGASP